MNKLQDPFLPSETSFERILKTVVVFLTAFLIGSFYTIPVGLGWRLIYHEPIPDVVIWLIFLGTISSALIGIWIRKWVLNE